MTDIAPARTGSAELRDLISDHSYQDIAERFRFGAPASTVLADFDSRSDSDLLRAASHSASALERERAVWEYVHRNPQASVDVLTKRLQEEPEPSVRWNMLWLLVKHGEAGAVAALKESLSDEHAEVRDWASLFLQELTGEPHPMEYDTIEYENDRVFDQTLPLQIAGFADVNVPGMGWVQARLSPQWFESILGRVLACTNTATYMTDLVIEKELLDYNEDGSNHYEAFLFRGASYEISDTLTQHIYESNTMRPFYSSGKVKEGPMQLMPVALSRAAGTERLRPKNLAGVTWQPSDGVDGDRGERLQDVGVFRSVRGRFWGWAYTDINRYLEAGTIEPGTVQLMSTADPEYGHLANTAVYGTFRGKLSDLNGDGKLNVNLIPSHGTLKGELDLDCDGVADVDPFVPQS